MQKPKVSIIVPVYNGAEFIGDTLRMILNTSMPEIEIIVIDDGSKDDSVSISQSVATEDPRVKVFCQKNTGVFGARNRGIKEAEGEFICFCDQDDVVEPDAYEKMYFKAKNNNCQIVMAGTGKLIGEKREAFESFHDLIFENDEIRKNYMLPILFNGTNCYLGNHGMRIENDIWKCMIKRKFVDEHKIVFRHYVNYEDDFLFLLDILARAEKVVSISDVLYYWRVNLKSETYNTAYVNELYAKDIRLQNEIIDIMRIAEIDNDYIELYRKCQNCNRYIHIVENESRNKGKRYSQKISTIKELQKEPEFNECLKIRSSYKSNLIHRKIILAMMEKHLFVGAYLFHKTYVWVREIGLRFQLWTKIENFLYSKG